MFFDSLSTDKTDISIIKKIVFLFLFFFESYSHQHKLMVFHCSLSDSMSPQVSRTFLSILADLNNVVILKVSSCPLISKSSCPRANHLVTIKGTTITNVLPSLSSSIFFQFSRKVKVLTSLFVFLQLYPVVNRIGKVHYSPNSLFFCWLSLGLVDRARLDDPFVSQNPREFGASHFLRRILGFV